MRNNESSENYLETILILSKKLPVVRSVDIANELGFKKSSVSIAMKNLREKNNITVSDAGFITLTESGRQIAEMIYERHELLSECLEKLGVDKEIAAEDACRIEHVITCILQIFHRFFRFFHISSDFRKLLSRKSAFSESFCLGKNTVP